jgi:hypothetical protein
LNCNPPKSDSLNNRVAYVLPKDYGYGFRGPNDKIRGLWEADALSYETSIKLYNSMEQYAAKPEFSYDCKTKLYNISPYSKLIFWNATISINDNVRAMKKREVVRILFSSFSDQDDGGYSYDRYYDNSYYEGYLHKTEGRCWFHWFCRLRWCGWRCFHS